MKKKYVKPYTNDVRINGHKLFLDTTFDVTSGGATTDNGTDDVKEEGALTKQRGSGFYEGYGDMDF